MDPGERQCLRGPLDRAAKEFPALNREARAEQLQAIFSRLRKHRDVDVAEAALALEVMSVPERVGRQSETKWKVLLDCGLLMRAARFLVVVTHRNAADRDIMAIPLYAGWN